ncbi:MAG: YwhD family protein [Planctomycetota bacterium]
MSFKMVGTEQPWRLQGPSGPVAVLGVVFEGDLATLDNGALHARSHLEAGIRFSEDPAAQGKGERVRNVWVAHAAGKLVGACSVELWIDRAAGTGWKRPIDHVNRMSNAVRGNIDVADLSLAQRTSLAELLAKAEPIAWEKSTELRQALA